MHTAESQFETMASADQRPLEWPGLRKFLVKMPEMSGGDRRGTMLYRVD